MKPFAVLAFLLVTTAVAKADTFDEIDSEILRKIANSPDAKKVANLGRDDLIENADVIPKVRGVMLIMRTNDARWAKLLIYPSAQKKGDDSIPTITIDRFSTYKDAQLRQTVAEGSNVRLFDGFHFNLDIGAIVPDKVLPDDLVYSGGKLTPVGKAEIYVVTKFNPELMPARPGKVVVGAVFQPQLFNGTYTVFDDGKRSGEMTLKVDEKGKVSGVFFSGANGAMYEVAGETGQKVKHGIFFTVTLPRTTQDFTGWMFTGNAQVITGFSNMEGREAGFYAVRKE